jgi:GNAT superfamily N-acetyltransferase
MPKDTTDQKNLSTTNNKPLIIRIGLEKDINAFFELYWISSLEHQKYNEKFDTLKTKDECKKYIIDQQKKLLNDKNHIFFIAEIDKKIVGIITGHIGKRDEADVYVHQNIGFIDELSVVPEHRKIGIGKKLIERILEELKNRKIEYVGIGAAYNNTTAIKLYKSYGFNPEGIWMLKNL